MSAYRPKVDYSLRPAKSTERRMVVETLAHLDSFVPLADYRYVGMGSIYFRDFQLAHRRLGIDDMISIEGTSQAEIRVRFNRPLACIEVRMGETGEVLPDIELEKGPHVLWLDYEARVDRDILSDIDEVVGRCHPGSVLVVTVNADRLSGDDRDRWLVDLGDDRPEPRDPRGRGEYALLSYRVLRERIDWAVDGRNAGVRDPVRRIAFRQTFHALYADGAQMLTLGGGLVAESDLARWHDTGVESLEFSRTGENPYRIVIPRLTRREVQHLLQSLPAARANVDEAARAIGVPTKDARDFAAVYRFAPLFVEVEDY